MQWSVTLGLPMAVQWTLKGLRHVLVIFSPLTLPFDQACERLFFGLVS